MEVIWSELVFGEAFYEGLKRKVGKRIINTEDAEEGVLYVVEKLAENDWARCKKFQGNSKPETFLFSVVHCLIGDFHRKIYGRQRPPEWLKRKGDLWIRIWNELCLKRQLPEALINMLCHDGSHEPTRVQTAIVTIKGKLPWCGYSNPPGDEPPEIVDPSPGPDSKVDEAMFEGLLEMCAAMLGGEHPDGVHAKLKTIGSAGLNDVVERFTISEEELLLLKMHFDDGLSFAEIARILKNVKAPAVRQKVTTVLTNMRQLLESVGVDSDTVESTLG